MSILDNNILQKFSPQEWVAKAYSEYMLDCAKAQADLLGSISDAVASETLDTTVDNLTDLYNECIEPIEEDINKFLTDEGTVVQDGFDYNNQQSQQAISQLYVDDINFKAKVDNLLNSFTNLRSVAINEIFSVSCDECILEHPTYLQVVTTLYNSIRDTMQYNDNTLYTLDDGSVSFKQMIVNMIKTATLNINDSFILNATGFNDQPLNNITTSYNAVITNMKEAMASAIAWGQGFASLTADNVSDALTSFDAKVKTVFNDLSASFTATISHVRGIIASTQAKTKAFFEAAQEMLGWNDIEDEIIVKPSETQACNYTGASPLSALNCKGAMGILAATGKTVVAAAMGIRNAAKSLATAIWSKVKPFFRAITNDPIDIGVIDTLDQSYMVNGISWKSTLGLGTDELVYYLGSNIMLPDDHKFVKMIDKLKGKWYAYESFFGAINFRITNWYTRYPENVGPYTVYLHIKYEYEYKPKNLDFQKLLTYGLVKNADINTLQQHLNIEDGLLDSNVTIIDNWLNNGSIYSPDSANEKDMYCGFHASVFLFTALMTKAAGLVYNTILNNPDYSNYPKVLGYSINPSIGGRIENFGSSDYIDMSLIQNRRYDRVPDVNDVTATEPDHVTNRMFYEVCSGYNSNGYQSIPRLKSSTIPQGERFYNNDDLFSQELIGAFIYILAEQQYDKEIHPTDYTFLPYCKDTYNFDGGRYEIKTDAQNINIANIIATAILLIVTVVAAIFITKSILKIFKAKKLAKFSGKAGVMDNAMWNGKKLSTIDSLKYSRYQKKLGNLTTAQAGLTSALSFTEQACNTVDKVQSTINFVNGNAKTSDSTSVVEVTVDTINQNLNQIASVSSNRQDAIYEAITGENLD